MTKEYIAPIHNTRRPNKVVKVFRGESKTQGSDQKESDIHYIMREIQRGKTDFNQDMQGRYGDFSGVIDLQAAKNIIADSNTMFEEIPATIRNQFDNDPGVFIDFMTNNENFDAIAEMGLDNAHLEDPTPPIEETPEIPPSTPEEAPAPE